MDIVDTLRAEYRNSPSRWLKDAAEEIVRLREEVALYRKVFEQMDEIRTAAMRGMAK